MAGSDPDTSPILDRFDLIGDEDGGVSALCRVCDSGGLPVAYRDWGSPGYRDDPLVRQVRTTSELLTAALEHFAAQHTAPPVADVHDRDAAYGRDE
jgi:hypothetical protein